MIFKTRRWSHMRCWSNLTQKSVHWSLVPDWAIALWVSWLWNINKADTNVVDKHFRVFNTRSAKSRHWVENI
jgi:hypothetical protein